MTSWLLTILVSLAAGGLCMALVRQPGVLLYDWFATRAREPAPAVKASPTVKASSAIKASSGGKQHEPATLAG